MRAGVPLNSKIPEYVAVLPFSANTKAANPKMKGVLRSPWRFFRGGETGLGISLARSLALSLSLSLSLSFFRPLAKVVAPCHLRGRHRLGWREADLGDARLKLPVLLVAHVADRDL